MHHGHSYLFTAGLFFALFYGLLLTVAYVPGLVRDTLRDRRRRKRGRAARSLRASGTARATTGKTQTRRETSTGSKASTYPPLTPDLAARIHGRSTYLEPSRISSPTRSTSVTVLPRGRSTTDAERG